MNRTLAVILFFLLPLSAEVRGERYALILQDPPVAELTSSQKDLRNRAATDRHSRILKAQSELRQVLADKKLRITGSTQALLNAIYIVASEEDAPKLNALPGVRRVVRMLPAKRHLNRAIDLLNARRAWDVVGGEQNAGAGVKIAILDSGVDHTHPGLVDESLPELPGYPKCRPEDCGYTNRKVVAARSYVSGLVYWDPSSPRPDDLSPRDRVGHGTAAAMIAAGVRNAGPAGVITGMAPKARIGNYKIFGSPGVNDVTFDDVIIQAFEDALLDGMDIAALSFGSPALWGPQDAGSACQLTGTDACDVRVDVVELAIRNGMTVVVSAGNDGDLGLKVPALNTVHSPGTAPSAITVGAITNAHELYYGVIVTGDAPVSLRRIRALFGNGPKPSAPLTAPLRDVSKLNDNGLACSPLTNGSLTGAIALIQRGTCGLAVKVSNAQRAGAIGVVLYQVQGSNFLFPPARLDETGIPAVLIGNTDGRALKSFLEGAPNRSITLDPSLEAFNSVADEVAYFSSLGPAIGDIAIKPEVVAVGTSIYTATQKFDPNGDMYDATGYTIAQGSSFAVAFVAGAAALIKQQNPDLPPAQIKSKVVNTANEVLTDYDADGVAIRARVTAIGAGKLNAADALASNITVDPATLSFGALTSPQLPSRGLQITNLSSSPVSLQFTVTPRESGSSASILITPSSLQLTPFQTQDVTVRLQGTRPAPGLYEGVVAISGGAVPVRIPYLYVVGDGVPFNMVPLRGSDFRRVVSTGIPITFKLIDRYGVPVSNIPVRFRAVLGGGSIERGNPSTDNHGIAEARVILGPQIGEQRFTAEAVPLTLPFVGLARLQPTVETNRVLNAASGLEGQGLAPGSYISIYGRGLSPAIKIGTTPWLPYSLAGVSVRFDVSSGSFAGRLHYVSDSQINVQVPWELQGMISAFMSVSIGDYSSAPYEVILNDYSPAMFEYTEASSGRVLAAALDEAFGLIGTGNAARRGSAIQLYVNGLGPVDNQPPTGEPAPSAEPLARTRVIPEVTIAGRRVDVLFSGLAPFFVGLYQVNVRVPNDAPTGIQPVVITANGVESKAVNIAVQ